MALDFPDAEVVARDWALNDSDIAALVATRVATRIPANPTFPFLTVFRLGGAPDSSEAPLDEVTLQWDCYGAKGSGSQGPDLPQASLLARTVVDKMLKTFDEVPSGSGYIYGFEVLNGPRRQPEPETEWARYVIDALMLVRKV